MTTTILTDLEKQLLTDSDWTATFDSNGNVVSLSKDDSHISGVYLSDFLIELLEDLKVDNLEYVYLTTEQICKKKNLSLICESPLELEDEYGNIITGECAYFLIQKFRFDYRQLK